MASVRTSLRLPMAAQAESTPHAVVAWARYAEAFIYIAAEKMFELAAPAAQEA
jgi:hypothetical protein